jgi:hypothetical protein
MSRPEKSSAAPIPPAPRFAAGWAALAYAIATLLLAWPALLGTFLVNPHSDQYIAGYAFRDFAAQSLRAGQGIPQWNPYLFGGLPYVAAMHGDIFYPTALLRVILPTDVAMTWGFVIHTFLAGCFTYAFLRAWGLGFFPSLVGGMAYLLGGPIASYASPGHDGKLFVSALLPLALWLLVRGIRDGRRWTFGALAITIGLAVLSPHPQLLQYLLLTSGAFALFLALGPDRNGVKLDRRTAVRRLAFALGAVIIGMAIGAIQYAPVREYVAYSPRAGGRDYAYATSYSFPLIELFNMYLPQFTGILDRYWGPNGIHLHSEYIGASVLLLASAAFGGQARRRFRLFWIGVAVVSFLWMLGGSTPFFHLVYAIVPGTKFFRAPSTIIYVFSFAVSVFAALGTERLLEGALSRRFLVGWLAAAAVVAVLASVGVIGAMAEAGARAAGASLFPEYAAQAGEQWASRANANGAEVILGAWRSFLFIALTVGALFWYLRTRASTVLVGAALAAIVAIDLWSVEREYWMFSPPARELFATDPALEMLKREPQPGRVVVFSQGDSGIVASDPYFGTGSGTHIGTGTGLMVHRIRSVTGYHGNEIGRYQTLMDMRLSNGAPALISPTFWRHENARYLYTNVPIADPALKLMTGPVHNSAGSTVYLYRLPGDNPYAWLATAIAKAPDSDAEAAVLDPRFDPARIAVFDTAAAVQPNAGQTPPEPLPITTTTSNLAPGQADISLSSPAPAGSALIVSENYYPGWSARVDGKPADTYRADYNLIGIPLPPDAKTVSLRYHDPAVATGRIVTIVALIAALAALAAGIAVDRRPSIA